MPTWAAQPHTLAKIEILRGYLNAWFPILGSSSIGRPIYYVDGFAGPGRYEKGEPGSPLVSLDCATTALITSFQQKRWRAGRIHCLFVESDREILSSLQAELESVQVHSWIQHQTYHGEFDAVLPRLREEHPSALGTSPLFVFLDPFGPKPLTFDTVAEILRSPTSEVLLHFDADGAYRMIRALEKGSNRSSSNTLNRVFGNDSWTHLTAKDTSRTKQFDETTRALVELYLARLRTVAEYAYPFQMITPSKSHISEVGYYLIMASNHPRGLEKMKEVMRTVGQGGQYRFSNFVSRQPFLFNPEESKAKNADALLRQFIGKTDVTWHEIKRYTLNDTDLISPKSMLKILEDTNRIVVRLTSQGLQRKKSTYPERLHPYIRIDFHGGEIDGEKHVN